MGQIPADEVALEIGFRRLPGLAVSRTLLAGIMQPQRCGSYLIVMLSVGHMLSSTRTAVRHVLVANNRMEVDRRA